jgi:hypothetical protein
MPKYWLISDRNNDSIGANPNVAGIIMATVRGDNSAQVKAQLATESAAKSTEVRNKIIVVRAAHAEGRTRSKSGDRCGGVPS